MRCLGFLGAPLPPLHHLQRLRPLAAHRRFYHRNNGGIHALHQESLPLVYHEDYSPPWPEEHRFPMSKFRDLASLLVDELKLATTATFIEPELPDESWIHQVHCPEYYANFVNGRLDEKAHRKIGLPFSEPLVRRTLLEVGGTVLAARLALIHGLACNLAGGTHHAHVGHGSGYTILNDLAVTARVLQSEGLAKKVCIIDSDVHQGDGTASIFSQDSSVFTLSFHCQDNWPWRKATSSRDVGFPAGTRDAAFLSVFRKEVRSALEDSKPDLVLYDAGVDMHERDKLGKMNLSDEGLASRDAFVIRECIARGIPVATVIGGGYSEDKMELARRHAIVFQAAAKEWQWLKAVE